MSRPADAAVRVSTLELFFDLVFVVTITQLTDVLVHHLTLEDALFTRASTAGTMRSWRSASARPASRRASPWPSSPSSVSC